MIVSVCLPVFAGEDKVLYRKAQRMAESGQQDFAFMQYRTIAKNYPKSKYISDALYASGEYYFRMREYPQSQAFFDRYIAQEDQEHEGILFVLMYQLWLANYAGDRREYNSILKDILAFRRQAFVFTDKKAYEYLSPLKYEHKVVYEIEALQFLVEGQPFTKIIY